MWNHVQTKYILFLCCTVSIVLMSSLCSTIIVFAQNHESSSFGLISPNTKFDFKREMSAQMENSNSTQIFQPEGIIVDSNDNLYVNDIQPNEIKKYDINGNFVLKWGNQTINGISLNHPHSSEIDKQGNIYITDQNNKRVIKFSPNGTLITSWGENENSAANFLHPHGIAVDSQNNVFVSDRDLDTIQKFSPNGNFDNFMG